MKRFIYADNAATTKLDSEALNAMLPWLQDEYGNASQPYAFSRKPKKALSEARVTIANCIGAQPEEIYFTSGGTESDNWAIKGMPRHDDRRETITSQIEHHAILRACESIERLGYPVGYLPVDNEGIVSQDILSSFILVKTRLVSVMLANNEIGKIALISALAKVAHSRGAIFHTDAVQAVGHITVNVKELGVDILSASAHKFNGPKGIGFIYIKSGTKIFPYADGGAQEHGMRAGTENIASIVGMAAALKKNCDQMIHVQNKLYKLEDKFLDVLKLSGIDYIRNGSTNHIPGNVNMSIRDVNGEMLLHRLDLKGIAISTGSACDSVNTQVSHVIQAIRVPEEYAHGTIRISFGRDNEEYDAVEIAKSIVDILKTKQ